MSSDPRVSIIIPTHNRPALLKRSLASATSQVGVETEIIVIDDGSDPPARLDTCDRVVLIRTENQGTSAARNAGLERARGTYVLFLDSDDWLEPEAVSRLLQTTETQQSAIAFGAWRNVDAASGEQSVTFLSSPYSDGLANALAGGWVTGSFLMARAIAARFDPSLKVWEITTFLCDSLAQGVRVATSDSVVVNIAQYEDPSRVSIRHDHFEPLAMARAFAAMKKKLAARDLLNADRIAAIDTKLLACLHALVCLGRLEAREVYATVDWAHAVRQPLYRLASFAWCARWGGLTGARAFIVLHRALGCLGRSWPFNALLGGGIETSAR